MSPNGYSSCLAKGVRRIDPRGKHFALDSIGMAMAVRDLMTAFRLKEGGLSLVLTGGLKFSEIEAFFGQPLQ